MEAMEEKHWPGPICWPLKIRTQAKLVLADEVRRISRSADVIASFILE
jgi:hypothetical protein